MRIDLLKTWLIDYMKHALIRTPLERPAFAVRKLMRVPRRLKNSELHRVIDEDDAIQAFMKSTLKPSMNCLDIGCHLGSMLSAIARLAYDGQHAAFEPVHRQADWIKKKFPEVTVFELALSDRSGEAVFYENIRRTGYSTLQMHGSKSKEDYLEYKVAQECLDRISLPNEPIHFMKVDTEGAELYVLRGARDTIIRNQPLILFELSNSGIDAFGISREEIFEFINESLGYRIYDVRDFTLGKGPLDLEALERMMEYPFQAFNFVAAPAD